ncbi:MAG: hypothetical protein QXQ73_02175, partial [Desulfurococcaceae archaeon]
IASLIKGRVYLNLARELKRDIIGRIMVILKIFANHAGSREALLQIELAKEIMDWKNTERKYVRPITRM